MTAAPAQQISLAGLASYLPERVVRNDFFSAEDPAEKSAERRRMAMFHTPTERRHVAPDEDSATMIEHAARRLAERLNIDLPREVDVILTNVSMPDRPFTGCGATVAHRLGCSPTWVMDLHNTGCVSFVYMLELARMIIATTPARRALLCTVQNAAGRIFSQPGTRQKPQAAIPGDGCGVAWVTDSSESPVLSVAQRCYGQHADDMNVSLDDGREYWEPGLSRPSIDFKNASLARIMVRGNRLVPELVREACALAEVAPSSLDGLITNQPNPVFLRNWREALQLDKAKHFDTFDRYGNLFGAGIPVTLDEAVQENRIPDGAKIALGGFSHAGDYAAAAVINWRAREYDQ